MLRVFIFLLYRYKENIIAFYSNDHYFTPSGFIDSNTMAASLFDVICFQFEWICKGIINRFEMQQIVDHLPLGYNSMSFHHLSDVWKQIDDWKSLFSSERENDWVRTFKV